jgi:hypothetical protein
MAGKIPNSKKIFVETDYDNVILVNPNEVYADDNKSAAPRLVDHEDLVYYANLETFIIPRTKLAIGESFDSPVFNTTIATVFGGDDDLKINFLKPKGGKTEFDTSWSDQITGKESRNKKGLNQKTEQVVSVDGNPKFKNSVSNYEDTQLLGIKRISVNVKGTGVPEVSIEMVDIQGRSLFEQGENSLYSAFFNFPYPLFYLTLKGYYGKAIRYRLSLMSFNAKFDADTGNYNISLKLIGKFTALLFDTPLQYAQTAPKMYNSQITINDPTTGNVRQLNTYKGRQKLHEVYQIYKRKGLIDKDFNEITIDEFKYRVNNFVTNILESLINDKKGDFTQLNDIIDYRENLTKLKKEVYENSLNNFLDRSSYYVVSTNGDNEIYYPFKKEISDQSKEDYKTKTQDRIATYVENLQNNTTFGTKSKDAKKQIPVTIKDSKEVIKKLDFNSWIANEKNVQNTFYFRTGKQYNPNDPNIVADYQKFVIDETENNELKRVLVNNVLVSEIPDYFVFGDQLVNNGVYLKNSYLFKLEKTLNTNEEIIEKELGGLLSKAASGNLGFVPTIRNVFAVIMAGADTFYRLMDDVHQDAWNVRDDVARLMSVIPPEKAFSPDALKALQTSSGDLNKDNVIYPWPLYFTLEKQKDGRELYTIQYPGDSKVINQTRAYDYRIWPEIGFVEAYLKGVVEKAKPEEGNLYENPLDTTKFVSANALEFPFKTLPYQDLDAIKTLYEIYERAYIIAHYSKLDPTIVSPKQIDKFYGDIESKNLSLIAPDDISLNKTLKELKLNLTTLLDYMKKISSNGQGDSWQTYLRSLFKTEYIENMLKVQDEIYSIDTLSSRSIKVSSDQPLVTNLTDYLKSTDSSKINTLDTYPFTNVSWLKENVSDGFTLNSFDEFNDTTKTFVYLQDKKTIARINETETYKNIKLFTDDFSFKNNVQPYITNQSNTVSVTTRQTLFDFYKKRRIKDYYITESSINYGTSYSGQVNTQYQTTSLLNTPYFINSIINGVELNKTKDKNAFVPLGYLYLNSMPLITTKERLKNINNDGTITDLDYLAATFKKYSAIHQVPYAWVLKYGSIWHRYKKYIETGVDILDSVWKDFDYAGSYDPVTSAITTQYTIPNYTGGSQNIRLQNTEVFPIPSIQSKDTINVGFYPKVINAVNNFVIGKDLFTGYTTSDFLTAYTKNKLRIGVNGQSTKVLNFGFDTANLNRSLIKQNYYQYREFSAATSVNQGNTSILLYPSMGGIPIDQSIFECVNDTDNLKTELLNNKSLYNGSVRSLWGTSHFGYFDNSLIKKPSPTQYVKNIDTESEEQYPFDIGSTQSFYSNIDEIFNIFTVEMLDKFEEKFLGFCNYNPKAKDISLTDEIISPTYNQTGGLHNLEEKSLVSQIKSLFVVSKTGIDFVNQNVDGKALATKQISSFTESVKKFLNFDCVIKLGNPGHFNRKLFNSFSNLTQFVPTDKYQFSPYIKGTLPGDGTSVTLLQSVAQNKDAWDSLRKYLGYSTIPKLDFQTQVQPSFPSVPLAASIPTSTSFVNYTYIPPIPTQTFRTFQDVCTGQYFNITDPNNFSSLNYTNGDIWYLDVVDSASQDKKFCARKVSDSAITTNYNIVAEDNTYLDGNTGNLLPESFCMSFWNTNVNCSQSPLNTSLQLEFVGDSSVILPETPNQDNINYFNIVKPSGGYTVYKLTGIPVFEPLNFSSTLFYPANSNINDPNNSSLPFNGSSGLDTNYARVFEVNGNTSGNYIMTVKYAVTGVSYQTLSANISTVSGNQTTTPTPTNPNPNVTPLQNTQKSYVTDFFIDNNIAFNSANVETAYPLIRLYAEQKLKDPTFNSTKFTTFINNYLTSQYNLQNGIVSETFTNLNKILKDIQITTNTQPVTVNGDNTKLTLYNTLKGFNDKWIAGSDLKTVTLFEDFLFMDRANSDIGDTYIVDVQKVVDSLDTDKNPNMNLMQAVSNILDDNQFMFMAMPAYINFYGLQEAVKNGKAVEDPNVGNSLFGTYLEVDYTKSSPKFLCLYMGNPSEYPKPKENSFNRFGDDSFDLRVPDNPLRVSDPNRDYSKTNKVVGFSVDFGIQNQSIFKTLDLDMSEMKNTSESFKVFADIGSSVAGDKVGQQSTSMYGVYKSRSYSCGVQSMGNVMIQPTMYFVLRHVPMFYGPYWIYEVNHNVSESGFDTDFKGTRIPKYSLPNVDNLLVNVNKKILSSFKEKIKKVIPESGVTAQSPTEKLLTEDPKIITTTEVKCRDTSAYPTIPFLDISASTYTLNEIISVIDSATTNTEIRALLLGIAIISTLNTRNNLIYNVINNNLYEITTSNAPRGNLATFITEQSCVDISGIKVPIAKFPNILTATNYMISYYQVYSPMIQNLKNVNPNIDVNVSYGKALTQLALTTWKTAAAVTSSLNAQQIKDYVENDLLLNNATTYDAYVKIFKDSYEFFVQNP